MVKITFIIPYNEIQEEVFSLLSEVNEEGVVIETTQIIGTKEALLRYCDRQGCYLSYLKEKY